MRSQVKILISGIVLLLSTIYIESSFPPPKIFGEIEGLDKVAHLVVYGILGVLILSFLMVIRGNKSRSNVLLTTILVFVAGLVDEVHQSYVPLRNVDGLDLLADTVGGIFACGFLKLDINQAWRKWLLKINQLN